MSWGEAKSVIQQQGISLIPETFIVSNSTAQNVYLAPIVPNSTYSGAIYKFSFNINDQLSTFAIIVPNVTINDFKGFEANLTNKYGDETYNKSGATITGEIYNYLNWGTPEAGYIGVTYLSTSNLLQITYFAPQN